MKGKNDNLEWGTWNAECDRCGFKFKAHDLKEEWTGWMVCDQCYEPRHPQDFLRGMPDDPSVPWSRGRSMPGDSSYTDVAGNAITTDNTFDTRGDETVTLTVGTDSEVQVFSTALTAARFCNFNTSGASARDRFIVYMTQTPTSGNLLINASPGATFTVPSVAVVEYNGSAWTIIDTYTL